MGPEPLLPTDRYGRVSKKAGTLLSVALLCLSAAAQAELYTIPWFVPAGAGGAPQGVLRILNGTNESGAVEIYAIDDAGMRTGPASFSLNASAAAEFTATDLQSGNAMLGLTGGIGAAVGDARLEIETDLGIVPLAYVRAADGTLSAMHDTVRTEPADGTGAYTYEVPLFNPASDAVQASRLRLINPGDAAASITIEGRDDRGAVATGGTVELTLAASAARTLTAMQLEAGATGLAGRLGAIVGRWRLTVSSDRPIQVINTVASAYGYINNLSTTAVAGSAPANHDAFNARFVGSQIAFRTDSGDFTFAPGAGDTFTVTAERDGAATSRTGRYGYTALGADAGRVTRSYDDALRCEANLYFATITGGWFASFCTDTDDPDGYWVGGEWSAMEVPGGAQGGSGPDTPTDGGGEGTPGSLGVCAVGMTLSGGQTCTYPGTGDEFSINARGRGSFLGRLAGIRIRIDSETIGGRVYDFRASHQGGGVWRIDRIEGRTEPQSVPHFAEGAAPQIQTYTVGTAIETLTLPAASGGNGTLTYSLAPEVPGLNFDPLTRRLTGTPTAAGDYDLTYSAADADGDVASLAFTLSVAAPVVPVVEVVQDYGDVRTVEATPPGRVHVSVVDLEDFGPGTHGEQITQTFLDNSSCASLDQLWGLRAFLIDGINRLDQVNGSGIVRHTLADDSGIFWTATNDSPWYSPGITDSFFFFVQDRPFAFEARTAAEWIRDHNVLVITAVENSTGEPTGNGLESTPLYCDDFDPDDPEGFIPLCGAMGDYIAHTGVGLEKTVFAGAIGRFGDAQAAIRADGVFARNTIYVESPDGTTSHATAVLAAYATNLAHANPTWSASQLRSELFRIARQERVNHAAGANASGAVVSERREVNVIRPAMAPACPL